jgi:hypothetical protein
MDVGIKEIRRMAYLEAMGIDSYVSRTQLPGAALTRRMAIASTRAMPGLQGAKNPIARAISAPAKQRDVGIRPGVDAVARIKDAVPLPPRDEQSPPRTAAVPRFSLTAIVAGDWLWLEELAGMPLATEQVQFVQSMARALVLYREPRTEAGTSAAHPGLAPPAVAQFDWPIHTNQQLDLGEEAARASVAGFVGRRMEQHGCHGLVLLGQSCAMRVPLEELKIFTVSTASSAEILAQPALKRTVWRDLLPLVSPL